MAKNALKTKILKNVRVSSSNGYLNQCFHGLIVATISIIITMLKQEVDIVMLGLAMQPSLFFVIT